MSLPQRRRRSGLRIVLAGTGAFWLLALGLIGLGVHWALVLVGGLVTILALAVGIAVIVSLFPS